MRYVAPALIFLLTACGQSGPGFQLSTLPNGRQVKVLNITKMFFSKGDTALILDYQTDLNLENKDALSKEVEDIWQFFKNDVEKANLKAAVVRANEAPKGTFIQTKNQYGFSFHKNQDGSWSRG